MEEVAAIPPKSAIRRTFLRVGKRLAVEHPSPKHGPLPRPGGKFSRTGASGQGGQRVDLQGTSQLTGRGVDDLIAEDERAIAARFSDEWRLVRIEHSIGLGKMLCEASERLAIVNRT